MSLPNEPASPVAENSPSLLRLNKYLAERMAFPAAGPTA